MKRSASGSLRSDAAGEDVPESDGAPPAAPIAGAFVSGRDKLAQDTRRRFGGTGGGDDGRTSRSFGEPGGRRAHGDDAAEDRSFGTAAPYSFNSTGAAKRGGAGLQRRGFKPPARADGSSSGAGGAAASSSGSARPSGSSGPSGGATRGGGEDPPVRSKILEEYGDNPPEQLRNLEPRLIEMIENEIMDNGEPVTFADIAGLDLAKAVMVESVVWPMQRPDLFQGLTRQAKGVLLFGPPGTGKTLIGKAVAHECGATFFAISASSLTSKWIGESEKLVRTLFAVAAVKQPSIIFIDEIDSLLTARGDGEHESSRRVKTEFLVQLDGAATKAADFVLVIGATNRPQELDEAARRRFTKRVYVPLPDVESRRALVVSLMKKERNELNDADVEEVVRLSDGYSGADLTQVCKEAAMGPLRAGFARLGARGIDSMRKDDLQPIRISDFRNAFETVKPSVAPSELVHYVKWNREFGAEASKSALPVDMVMRARQSSAASVQDGDADEPDEV